MRPLETLKSTSMHYVKGELSCNISKSKQRERMHLWYMRHSDITTDKAKCQCTCNTHAIPWLTIVVCWEKVMLLSKWMCVSRAGIDGSVRMLYTWIFANFYGLKYWTGRPISITCSHVLRKLLKTNTLRMLFRSDTYWPLKISRPLSFERSINVPVQGIQVWKTHVGYINIYKMHHILGTTLTIHFKIINEDRKF